MNHWFGRNEMKATPAGGPKGERFCANKFHPRNQKAFRIGLCIFLNWFTLFFFRSYQVYLGSMGDCTVFGDCIEGYEHECREYEIRRREECLKRQEQKRTVKYFLLSFF